MKQAKPFCITKRQVWETYKRAKANKGTAGVDGQTFEKFVENLQDNLRTRKRRVQSEQF